MISSGTQSVTAPKALHGLRIMLAEDCPDQSRLFANLLVQLGADVTLECNGKAAVSGFAARPSDYDAILLDFQMPELDGLEATKEIRALGFTGALVALTAFATEELRSRWIAAGCTAFLEKPATKKQLCDAIMYGAKR